MGANLQLYYIIPWAALYHKDVNGLHALSGVLAEHAKQLLLYLTFALFPFPWGENGGKVFDSDCPLSHNNSFDLALILWLYLHEFPPIS